MNRTAPLILGAAFLVPAALAFGDARPAPPVLLITVVLGSALLALSLIDVRTMRLPDAMTIPLIVAGPLLAFLLGWSNPVWHAAAAALAYLTVFGLAEGYRAATGREGLGMGDAKLFAAAGGWLGPEGLPSVLLVACLTALAAVACWHVLVAPVTRTTRIPFGPALALGFWGVWLFGPIA